MFYASFGAGGLEIVSLHVLSHKSGSKLPFQAWGPILKSF